jgi:hypothetical protein
VKNDDAPNSNEERRRRTKESSQKTVQLGVCIVAAACSRLNFYVSAAALHIGQEMKNELSLSILCLKFPFKSVSLSLFLLILSSVEMWNGLTTMDRAHYFHCRVESRGIQVDHLNCQRSPDLTEEEFVQIWLIHQQLAKK